MDILRLTRKGSPFLKSQAAESNRVLNVKNPTAEVMRTQISEAIFDLHGTLEAGEIGELVVYFSGHGSSGNMSGINWKVVTRRQMLKLANLARDFNIHMVYILDTCRGGPLTNTARVMAVDDIHRGYKLPVKQWSTLRGLGNFGYQLMNFTLSLGSWVRHYFKRRSTKRFRALFDRLTAVCKLVSKLGNHLRKDDQALNKLPELSLLKRLQSKTSMTLLYAYEGTRGTIRKAMRNIARLIDALNDTVNRLIKEMYKASKGQK